ncbi:RND transporter [Geotalea uraniireducens]|uniref:RND transporter n=1 Tax=Geotalea uraniireducens TaxID=351604 RepID=A0ABN6VVH3_9BACT|nr:TolC family protein [Geotalea uraniireducens]BDV42075.1 RND transporter [Geotalea uraniireducens]
MRNPHRAHRFRLARGALLLLALLPLRAWGAPLNLTLTEAVKLAVERNLDVKAELYNPAMAEATVRQNRGIYDPALTLSTTYTDSTTLPASSFLAGADTNKERTLTYDLGISRLLPSGGTIGAALTNSWNRNNADPTRGFLDRYYESEFNLTFAQPLLKNFGREATELNIAVAGYGKDAAQEQFTTRLIATVAQVRTEYYKLYSLRDELAVKQASLKLAEQVLADTRGRVNAGVLPSMEITNAEYGVALREKELIDAERAVQDQEDVLRLLLQVDKGAEIVPTEAPAGAPLSIDERKAIDRALRERTELKTARVNLKIDDLQTRVAVNRTRPDLSFTGSIGTTGLAQDYNRALERVGSTDYPVWSVGLQFSYPLGNTAAKNELIRNRLKAEQSRTQLKSLEESTANEVRSAIRAVSAGYKQLEVTDKARAYAEERLQAYLKKSAVGLATIKDVLDVENDLATARDDQITARANYVNAVTQYWQATGELLQRQGVTLTDPGGERLYDGTAGTSPPRDGNVS